MALERERKFLFKGDFRKLVTSAAEPWLGIEIEQGYLMLDSGKQLRIRLIRKYGELHAFICYKFKVNETDKQEFEYEIPLDDGIALMASTYVKFRKERWSRTDKETGNVYDIDVYPHNGWVVVEVEYKTPELGGAHPAWLGEEVTGQKDYSNIRIAKQLRKEFLAFHGITGDIRV